MISFLCIHSTYLDGVLSCSQLCPGGFHSCCITHPSTVGRWAIWRERHFTTSFGFTLFTCFFTPSSTFLRQAKNTHLEVYILKGRNVEDAFSDCIPNPTLPHNFPPAGFIMFKICLLTLSFFQFLSIIAPRVAEVEFWMKRCGLTPKKLSEKWPPGSFSVFNYSFAFFLCIQRPQWPPVVNMLNSIWQRTHGYWDH